MTIVFFATRFAFEYSVELSNHILRREEIDRVYLFLPDKFVSKAQLDQLDAGVRFESFDLPGNKRPWSTFKSMSRVISKIKKIDPDIVHIQGSGHPYFWLHQGKISNIPVVDTIHDAEPHPGFGSFLQSYMRRKAVKNAQKWFIHGNSLKELYQRINPEIDEKDIVVIPKGHYGIFKNYSDETQLERKNSVLFFGNITRYKGIMILIEASKTVIDEIPDVKFVIAGRVRAKDKDDIDLSPYENHPNFELMNYRLSEKEVSDIYQSSGILVLPYIEASQSGVLSIGFGLGKAAIATRVGALPEIIEHEKTGILIEPNDPDALAEEIIRLLKNNELRKKLGQNALQYAHDNLSWETVADITLKKYKELINEN